MVLAEVPITSEARSIRAAERIVVRAPLANEIVDREEDRDDNNYGDSWSWHGISIEEESGAADVSLRRRRRTPSDGVRMARPPNRQFAPRILSAVAVVK